MIVIFLASASFLLKGSEAVTSTPGWNNKKRFTDVNKTVLNFSSDSKGNFSALVYEAIENNVQSVYIMISVNFGRDFFPPVKIAEANIQDQDKPYRMNPKVAVSSKGKVFVVWQDFDQESYLPIINYSSSMYVGGKWSSAKKLSFVDGAKFLPAICYDSQEKIHVFYHGLEDRRFYLYHTYSVDEINFSQSKKLFQLTGNFRGAFFPKVLPYGNNIFIAWQGKSSVADVLSDDLYFIRSTDFGESWGNPVKITSDKADDSSPNLAVIDGKIYCTYLNNSAGNREAYLTISDDFGFTWNKALKIVETNVNVSNLSVTSNSEKNPVFFWSDNSSGRPGIYTRKISINENGEEELSDISPVSDKNDSASDPTVLRSGVQFLCIWMEGNAVFSKLNDIYAVPPEVKSKTHPFEKWTKSSNAVVYWNKPRDESGIAGYAYIVNDEPYFNPVVQNVEPNISRIRVSFLKDGVNYFHIRSIDGAGNFSRTVHFPLLISSTPLPMPIVSSPTHPENKKSNKNSGKIIWEQKGGVRLKGFKYSLSKGKIKAPSEFTVKKEFNFKNLPEGRYFFTVVPVDKTNTLGNEATYIIVIGDVGEIDPDYYEKIAKGTVPDKTPKQIKTVRKAEAIVPGIELVFDKKILWESSKRNFSIKVLNRAKYKNLKIEGLSFVFGEAKIPIPEKVVTIKNNFTVENIKNGKNVIGVSVKYSYLNKRGKSIQGWTKPIYEEFSAKIPDPWSPLMIVENKISDRSMQGMTASLLLVILCGLGMVIINGANILKFYFKIFIYRVKTSLMLVFSQIRNYFLLRG